MNNAQLNIDNLTRLWTIAGQRFQSYSETESFCCSHIENSEWPRRIWTNKPLSEQVFNEIKHQMDKEKVLTFSAFGKTSTVDPLIKETGLTVKSIQYGMSLPLAGKFSLQKALTLKEVRDERQAEIWSKAFYQAFNYNIHSRIIFNTSKDIKYFLVYDQEELVGTVLLLVTNKVLGIHSLGILPVQRKKGFATEIMHHVLNEAIDNGLTMATLQASEMAKEMYLKIGFFIDFLMTNYILKP